MFYIIDEIALIIDQLPRIKFSRLFDALSSIFIIRHRFSCFKIVLHHFLADYTGTILVGARRSLTIVFLVPNTGDAILGLPLPHMSIVWRCATRASIVMVPASFLSQVICGTLYLLLPFHPLTICLLSRVGCISTS